MNRNEVWILEEIPEFNLDIKNKDKRSGDMNQSIRYLLHKNKDLGSGL